MLNSDDLSRVKIEASEDYFVSIFRNSDCFRIYSICRITRILVQRRREGSANVGRGSVAQRIHELKDFACEIIIRYLKFLYVESRLNKSFD